MDGREKKNFAFSFWRENVCVKQQIIHNTLLCKIPYVIPNFNMIYMTCNVFIGDCTLFLTSDFEVIMFMFEVIRFKVEILSFI